MSSPDLSPLDPEGVQRAVAHALAAIAETRDVSELKLVRVEVTGERSPLALANRQMGAIAPVDKAEAGKRIGAARAQVAAALAERESVLEAEEADRALCEENVDMSLVARRHPVGARHPLGSLQDRVCDVFVAMGWEIAEGPEIEAEWLNFDALNFDGDHPARQMMDTFYVEPLGSGLVLRTHTSPVQARALLSRELPVYVLAPGKTFRTDELDATHTPVFHQFEGIAIDRNLTMSHLKGTLDHFAATIFGPQAVTRLRPSFFPFTEPSAEMDLRCFVCVGEGDTPDPECRTCGGTGWIEWGGCGMVHPNVLRSSGIDPEEYRGFAFGMGIERALMFRHDVADMHDLVEGDIRFSRQFGMEI